MTMQHSIQDERNILLRPHTGQFVIDELPLMFVCMAGLVYGGMEGLPLSSMARIVSLFLLLVLLYRFIYLRRIRYRVGEEQLVSEHGIFIRRVDYMELYRIVDFQEHQSLLQQICGLKTVRILSMDRTRQGSTLSASDAETTSWRLSVNVWKSINEKRESMRLRIISIWAVLILAGLLPQLAKAQIAASNPLEWAALAEGNELINGQIDKQIKGQTQTALMQNSIAAEFNRIHEWEKQYNSYLKTASGYASSLKACTHLYNDGVRIFLTLEKLGKAIRNNPQGIVASMNMNNLYIETATELVSVFTLLNDAVAKGGTENMLTGAERSKTLWALNDQLAAFSRKLHLLYLSLRYYTLNDVWNNITAGMIDRSNGEVARLAMSRWRRAAATAR